MPNIGKFLNDKYRKEDYIKQFSSDIWKIA